MLYFNHTTKQYTVRDDGKRRCFGSATDKFKVQMEFVCLPNVLVLCLRAVCIAEGLRCDIKCKQISSKQQNGKEQTKNTVSIEQASLPREGERTRSRNIESKEIQHRKVYERIFNGVIVVAVLRTRIANTIVANKSFTFVTNATRVTFADKMCPRYWQQCIILSYFALGFTRGYTADANPFEFARTESIHAVRIVKRSWAAECSTFSSEIEEREFQFKCTQKTERVAVRASAPYGIDISAHLKCFAPMSMVSGTYRRR